jgi:hypothetical protein
VSSVVKKDKPMKINITLDGIPEEIEDFLTDGFNHATLQESGWIDLDSVRQRAADVLEQAVKDGHATILLGEITESRKLAAAGCL